MLAQLIAPFFNRPRGELNLGDWKEQVNCGAKREKVCKFFGSFRSEDGSKPAFFRGESGILGGSCGQSWAEAPD